MGPVCAMSADSISREKSGKFNEVVEEAGRGDKDVKSFSTVSLDSCSDVSEVRKGPGSFLE